MNPDEQARLVQRDFDRMKVVKHAEIAARAPFVADAPLVEGGQGKSAAQMEFNARVFAWCAAIIAILVIVASLVSLNKGGPS